MPGRGVGHSGPAAHRETARDLSPVLREIMARYESDALIDSLAFDAHEEGHVVEASARAVRMASDN